MGGKKREWDGPPYGKHEWRGEWSATTGYWDHYDECLAECWPNLRRLEGLDEFRAHMLANKWQFGKTTPEAPHWYTLRKTWRDSQEWWRRGQRTDPAEQELFIQCIQFIREHGKEEVFWKQPYIKLTCDGFKYWSNGWPLDVCVVINRAEHPSPVFDEAGNRLKTFPKAKKEGTGLDREIGYSLPNRDSAGPRYGKHDKPEEVAECVTECWGHLDKLKNLDEFRELVRSNKWQFAKTMPQNPHWYTLRKTWVREEEFIRFTQYIRDNGSLEWFWGMSYRKLICDGFKYWSSVGLAGGLGCKGCTGKHCRCPTTYGVGDPLDITTLVNRAEHPSPVFDEVGNRLTVTSETPPPPT